MKKKDIVLLLSKDKSYLVEPGKESISTSDGIFNTSELWKKQFGDTIKTHIGKEFIIVKPYLKDVLEKKVRRGAQVVLPKDVALILAYTGIPTDSLVVDCGTGTGYMCIFLAYYLCRGKVVTYEKNKEFAKIARENIRAVGLKNILLKEKDVTKGIGEENVDLVTVDIQHPERVVKHAYKSLKPGGFLVVYSPTVEELITVNKEIKSKGFCDVKTIENIVREWQVEFTTRPKTIGLMHTGWLTFARKVK
jgi:tRNA (adenine57-N1/adenine58-N1)-methyltransferase